MCHIVVADANRCNTNNLQLGDGDATVRRCSEVNVKRATAHDYSATIPPLENIAYSETAQVCAKRDLTEIPPVHCLRPLGAPQVAQVSAIVGASCASLCPIRKNRSRSDQTGKGYFLMPPQRSKCATERQQRATAGSGSGTDPENVFVGSLPGASCSGHSFFDTTPPRRGYRHRRPKHEAPIAGRRPA